MRKFVMFYQEKEGTSAIVRFLDNFPQVDVVHLVDGYGYEPFDRHTCGPMPLEAFITCLDRLFAGAPMAQVNEVYTRTATKALAEVDRGKSVGFKMRFQPPRRSAFRTRVASLDRLLAPRLNARGQERFAREMIDLLVRHEVLVLMAVRQDVFRWALSKYHGDGTTRPGHIQFNLASGSLRREDIPRVRVDPAALEQTIRDCEAAHAAKRRLARRLEDAGLQVVPVRYEDLLADDVAFFGELLRALGHDLPADEVRRCLSLGAGLERVHGDDLSEFFLNADELVEKLGHRFEAWR